jgi:hypothetical protein
VPPARTSGVLDRIRVFDAPAEHFNPAKATARQLKRYGFPERPDPKARPELARLWKQVFSPRLKVITPELRAVPGFSSRKPKRGKPKFFDDRWAGAVVDNGSLKHPGETIEWAFGQFMVPQVAELDPVGDDMTVGFWVGIDGIADKQVLQAGVRADVSQGFFSGGVDYSAFIEWIDEAHMNEPQDRAVTVDNFPVRPGDWISVLICAPLPDVGHIVVMNLSWGSMFSINLKADPGIGVNGSSAEWIVEPPGFSALPFFYEVAFMNCWGGTPSHLFDLTQARTLEARGFGPPTIDAPGRALTASAVACATVATVQWRHFDQTH